MPSEWKYVIARETWDIREKHRNRRLRRCISTLSSVLMCMMFENSFHSLAFQFLSAQYPCNTYGANSNTMHLARKSFEHVSIQSILNWYFSFALESTIPCPFSSLSLLSLDAFHFLHIHHSIVLPIAFSICFNSFSDCEIGWHNQQLNEWMLTLSDKKQRRAWKTRWEYIDTTHKDTDRYTTSRCKGTKPIIPISVEIFR